MATAVHEALADEDDPNRYIRLPDEIRAEHRQFMKTLNASTKILINFLTPKSKTVSPACQGINKGRARQANQVSSKERQRVLFAISSTREILADYKIKTGFRSVCQMHTLLLLHILSRMKIPARRIYFKGHYAVELVDTGYVADAFPSSNGLHRYCFKKRRLKKRPGLIIKPGSQAHKKYYSLFEAKPVTEANTKAKFRVNLQKILSLYSSEIEKITSSAKNVSQTDEKISPNKVLKVLVDLSDFKYLPATPADFFIKLWQSCSRRWTLRDCPQCSTTLADQQKETLHILGVSGEQIVDLEELEGLDEAKTDAWIRKKIGKGSREKNAIVLKGLDLVVAQEMKIRTSSLKIAGCLAKGIREQALSQLRTATQKSEFERSVSYWGLMASLNDGIKNAIIWGNRNKAGSVVVINWRLEADALLINIVDGGQPFNPEIETAAPRGVSLVEYGEGLGFREGIKPHLTEGPDKQGRYGRALKSTDGKEIAKVLTLRFPLSSNTNRNGESRNNRRGETVPGFLEEIKSEIVSNPIAQKMDYEVRLEAKIGKLLHYFSSPDKRRRYFFEQVLFNVSIKEGDLIDEKVLGFLDWLTGESKEGAILLFMLVWPKVNPVVKEIGLSEDKQVRDELKNKLFNKIDVIRRYAKIGALSAKQIKKVVRIQKILKLDIIDVLKIVTISPHILRGLRKTPRPLYAWIIPALAAAPITYTMVHFIPALPVSILYFSLMLIMVLGTYWASMYLKIAPGILYYKKTKKCLSQIIEGTRGKTKIQQRMVQLGLDVQELEREKIYEAQEKGIRIVIRNKKALRGAVKFLTSSDEIGSCTALENFVSYTIPSLLDDDGILLADVYYKGTQDTYTQRAQIWMVAAEENGEPVLVVNSLEFNNEGAKYIDELMPEMIKVLQDVAKRAGFKKIYAGISTFGRKYLDQHFSQGETKNIVKKVYHSEAGYKYYFDAFALKPSFAKWRIKREFIYEKKRGLFKRTYALIFGLIEFAKGNRAKAGAFFDTVLNANNFWQIPLKNDDPFIAVMPDGKVLSSEKGEILLDVLERNDIKFDTECGRRGSCEKCAVRLNKGKVKEKGEVLEVREGGPQQKILSCQSRIIGDTEITIPSRNRVEKPKILEVEDWGFLKDAQGLNPIVDAKGAKMPYALAVDIGTTTVAASLVPLNGPISEDRIRTTSSSNWQVDYGADIMRRIQYVQENEKGLDELKDLIIECINKLVRTLAGKIGIKKDSIVACVFSANSTMLHLALGLDPRGIGHAPYKMASGRPKSRKASDLSLEINPDAQVFSVPCVHGFLGGDVIADLLVSKIAEAEELSLLIDFGTNGEIVLGNKDGLLAASCAIGPAFEGMEITCGMKAQEGAIEAVEIDSQTLQANFKIIGDKAPSGICGAGLVDLLAEMARCAIVNKMGRINEEIKNPGIRKAKTMTGSRRNYEYVIWQDSENPDRYISITEKDIKTILLAKSAAHTGIKMLLKEAGKDVENIGRIYIAGGFGAALDIEKAVYLGLLPDILLAEVARRCEKYSFIGNGSLKGAILTALNKDFYSQAHSLVDEVKYIDLQEGERSQIFGEELFTEGWYLPEIRDRFSTQSEKCP
ncbi:MAG: DUF4445 domain-containing protein [Dehalococcoidia bacterium]|nr:MAG: DUF4445 domain-containing protein [Dehalococcoidia bacterium]